MASDLVIFDCDGVLIDSELIACRSCAACLAEIGIPVTADQIAERYIGVTATAMFADLEARFGIPLPLDFAEKVRIRLMRRFNSELTAMPGVEAALSAIQSPVCVASSSAPDRLRHTLSLVGLLSQFDPHIFSATQVARGKPAPDLFLFAAAQMDAEPSTCLVVEDSVSGVTAAVAAGMRVIGFTGGSHCKPGHAERLRYAGATGVITAFGDLLPLIQGRTAIPRDLYRPRGRIVGSPALLYYKV